jgi:hypothetical protein
MILHDYPIKTIILSCIIKKIGEVGDVAENMIDID